MIDREYKVRFITSKNSFLFLSDKDFRKLDQDLLIRLYYGVNKVAYFSLGPSLSFLKEGELAMCPILAKELGIFRGDVVTLSSTTYISSVRRMHIVAETDDDYEILETVANNVQSTLLNQVRIVHNNQKLIVWISNSLHATVNVESVTPISPGRLENLTAVTIIPPYYKKRADNIQDKTRSSSPTKETILKTYNKSQTLCRLHPLEDIDEVTSKLDDQLYFEQPFNVFLSKRILPQNFDSDINTTKDVVLVALQTIPIPESEITKTVIVRLFAIEDICAGGGNSQPIIFANKFLFEHLRAEIGTKIILEPYIGPLIDLKTVEIATTKPYFGKADELVRSYLSGNCRNGGSFLINSDVALKEAQGCDFSLKFVPEAQFCLIDSKVLRYTKFVIQERELVVEEPQKKDAKEEIKLCMSCNYEDIVNKAKKCSELKLIENRCRSSNVMIVGKQGTGKSSLINFIQQNALKKPHRIHSELISCKKLKGKNIESLQKVLTTIFSRLIYFQPSLLILDDLHVICERVAEGDAPSPENIHFNKVSDMLADVLENYLETNRISILATSESVAKLNQHIFASRGKHLFHNVLTIDDLNKGDRAELMKYFFALKEIECKVDFDLLSARTEGFVVQDLIDYVDKVIFEAYKDNSNNVCDKHCELALKNASSLSLREVQLHSPGDRDFKDIGGLENVKKILVECMLWPAQYPNIFGRAPLRLQSGLLLYGPPGTGKTILAGAAAKHCNLRLISIKGPELLSKYIGASEQAVRDVFQKAQSARPCILFFDEFDSLAPRRGHDNTGVTDRVVNQFLTQLDGVETLSGVCVLAATSRPDLLDPALLRPGRLDRQILCPVPDRESRLSILKALSKSLPLGKDVNMDKLADDTVGYSGADLQAVLYTAQLSTVEHLLDENAGKYDANKINLITQNHLEEAVKTTRPSLTREEKLKYERIYSKFQGNDDLLDLLKAGKQKATLA